MDRVLIGPFDITTVSQYLWAYRWVEELEQWTGNRCFIFLLPSSHALRLFHALRKMLHSPRLAHKAQVRLPKFLRFFFDHLG